jgi:hypothetical protein
VPLLCISYGTSFFIADLDLLYNYATPQVDGSLDTIFSQQDGVPSHFNHHLFTFNRNSPLGGLALVD